MLKSYFPRGVPEDFFAFDDLYSEGSRSSGVPVPLYRAIGSRETSNDSSLVNKRTGATGLLQILPVVWHDWNKKIAVPRGDKILQQKDLLEPQVNVAVGSWLMSRIVEMFRNHPSVKIDWRSLVFVELFIFAYHAGLYGTEAAIRALEVAGGPITIERVVAKSKEDLKGTFPYAIRDPSMLDRIASYDKLTALLYDKTRPLKPPREVAQAGVPKSADSGLGALATGMLAATIGVTLFGGRRRTQS